MTRSEIVQAPIRRLTFRQLQRDSPADMTILAQVIRAAPEYCLPFERSQPGDSDAETVMRTLPPGKTAADLFVFALCLAGEPVGCVHIVRACPMPKVAFLGLLLFAAEFQNRGLGVHALAQIEALARSWGCESIQAVIDPHNTRSLHARAARRLLRVGPRPRGRLCGASRAGG